MLKNCWFLSMKILSCTFSCSFFYEMAIEIVMIYFTLFSRSYCHLCDDMRVALEKLLGHIPYQLTVFDVDNDAILLDLYDELVPVLFASREAPENSATFFGKVTYRGEKLCHYFLDEEKIKAF